MFRQARHSRCCPFGLPGRHPRGNGMIFLTVRRETGNEYGVKVSGDKDVSRINPSRAVAPARTSAKCPPGMRRPEKALPRLASFCRASRRSSQRSSYSRARRTSQPERFTRACAPRSSSSLSYGTYRIGKGTDKGKLAPGDARVYGVTRNRESRLNGIKRPAQIPAH